MTAVGAVFVVHKMQFGTESLGGNALVAVLGITFCDFRCHEFFAGDRESFYKARDAGSQ